MIMKCINNCEGEVEVILRGKNLCQECWDCYCNGKEEIQSQQLLGAFIDG